MLLKKIEITICEACLDGIGSECHTPGCALCLHKVDLPIDINLYRVIKEFPQQIDSPNANRGPICDCKTSISKQVMYCSKCGLPRR